MNPPVLRSACSIKIPLSKFSVNVTSSKLARSSVEVAAMRIKPEKNM